MKQRVLFLTVLVLAATASGQWLERTIWLPDSFPEFSDANRVFRNPVTDRLYFSGVSCEYIHIYDVPSQSKYGFIPGDGAYQCEHCPAEHTIWVSVPDPELMFVVDDRADTLLAELEGVLEPLAIEYNPTRGKVYSSDWDDDLVVVFDAATAEVLDTIEVGFDGALMAWDSIHDAVYCAGWLSDDDSVAVIDCSADTVVARIPGTRRTTDVLLHPDGERLYCLSPEPQNVVRIVDTDSRVVVDSVVIPTFDNWGDHGRLVLNPVSNALYCLAMDRDLYVRGWGDVEDTLAVIDCTADTLLGLAALGLNSDVSAFAVNEHANKVYVSALNRERIAVLAVPDSVTGWLELGVDAAGVAWSPTDNRVYLTLENDSVLVADGTTDSIIDRVRYYEDRIDGLHWVPGGNKLYVWQSDSLGVLESGDSVVRRVAPAGGFVAYWSELNRMYFRPAGNSEGLVVFDCNRDSAVGTIAGATGAGPVLPELNRLYLTHSDSTYICDLLLDSVVGTASGWGDLVYNPRNGLLYGSGRSQQDINVIDPITDSVVATVPDFRVESMVANTADNEVYFIRDYQQNRVFVLDGATHAIDDTIDLAGDVELLAWLPEVNKLYGIGEDNLEVADCRTRQPLATIEMERLRDDAWLINERTDRFWIDGRNGLAVVDYRADTVAALLDVNAGRLALGRIDDRVYAASSKRLSVIRDGVPGVEEERAEGGGMRAERVQPTVLRGPELMRMDCRVLDIQGRDVTDRKRSLSPGVYFIREGPRGRGSKGSRVRKVILQR